MFLKLLDIHGLRKANMAHSSTRKKNRKERILWDLNTKRDSIFQRWSKSKIANFSKMACPLNRKKFSGSGYSKEDEGVGSKEVNGRLKELMAVREAQDGGNFKATTSWSSSVPVGAPGASASALDAFFIPSPMDPNKNLKK